MMKKHNLFDFTTYFCGASLIVEGFIFEDGFVLNSVVAGGEIITDLLSETVLQKLEQRGEDFLLENRKEVA